MAALKVNTKDASQLIGIIVVISFLMRAINIDALVPMVDEAGHLWESINYSMYHPLDRLISGKYLGYLFFKPIFLLTRDPLYGARMLVALFSSFTIYFIYLSGRSLGSNISGLVAALLYAISPFSYFHDRQAIFDPMAATFYAASLYFLLIGLKEKRYLLASGLVFIFAVAIKALVLAGAGVFFGILFAAKTGLLRDIAPMELRRIREVLIIFAVGICAGLLLLIVISPSPGYALLSHEKLMSFWSSFFYKGEKSVGVNALIVTPIYLISGYFEYAGFVFSLLMGYAIVYSLVLRRSLSLIIIATVILGVGSFGLLSVTFYRYVLYFQVPALIFVGLVIDDAIDPQHSEQFLLGGWLTWNGIRSFAEKGLLTLFLISILHQAYICISMMHNPYYKIAIGDKFSYETGWGNAIGMKEVATAIEDIALHSDKKIHIVTIGWGMPGVWNLPLLLRDRGLPISFYHEWIHNESQLVKLKEIMKTSRVIFLLEHPVLFVTDKDMLSIGRTTKVLFSYQKKDPASRYELVEILP